jgi:hypothetical protein
MDSNNDLLDILMVGGSAEEAADRIKQVLYAKSAEKINLIRPAIAQAMFGDSQYQETGED